MSIFKKINLSLSAFFFLFIICFDVDGSENFNDLCRNPTVFLARKIVSISKRKQASIISELLSPQNVQYNIHKMPLILNTLLCHGISLEQHRDSIMPILWLWGPPGAWKCQPIVDFWPQSEDYFILDSEDEIFDNESMMVEISSNENFQLISDED